MVSLPVRLPLPPAVHEGSIYENQTGGSRFYFEKADAR
jgi:phytanoyl-CoA hydroxylase